MEECGCESELQQFLSSGCDAASALRFGASSQIRAPMVLELRKFSSSSVAVLLLCSDSVSLLLLLQLPTYKFVCEAQTGFSVSVLFCVLHRL